MARRRHEIDPTTQASFLPIATGALALGQEVVIEGGYYAVAPTQAPTVPTSPEVKQQVDTLKAEDTTLEFLMRARATEATITKMSRGRYALRQRGGSLQEQGRLTEAIETSKGNYRKFHRVAKKFYGKSVDIETIEVTTEHEFDEHEGTFRDMTRVVAKDPEEREKLNALYRQYKLDHDTDKKCEARREEIQATINGLQQPSVT